MPAEKFESEIREIFDEKFVERAKNLKKSGNIFNPVFYLLFTRLVELSAIINDVVLPNKFELEELFKTRKEFLQIDYKTLNETLRRAWIFERKRGEEYTFSGSIEDMLYLLHRMGDIQKRIDELIFKYAIWKKDSLVDLYFVMIKVFLELEDRINEIVLKELGVSRESSSSSQ
jgi:hypothetical protein